MARVRKFQVQITLCNKLMMNKSLIMPVQRKNYYELRYKT